VAILLFYISSSCFLIIALSTSCGIPFSVLRSVLSICCFWSSTCFFCSSSSSAPCLAFHAQCLFSLSFASRAYWNPLLVWSSSYLSWSTWPCKGLGWKLEVRKLTFAQEPEEGFVAMSESQKPAGQRCLLVPARSYQLPVRHSSSTSDPSSVKSATVAVQASHCLVH